MCVSDKWINVTVLLSLPSRQDHVFLFWKYSLGDNKVDLIYEPFIKVESRCFCKPAELKSTVNDETFRWFRFGDAHKTFVEKEVSTPI